MQVEIYRDKAGEFRWRKVAANGRIVAESGEGYTRHADALEAAEKFGNDEPVIPARDEKDEALDRDQERLDRENEEELRRQERVDER